MKVEYYSVSLRKLIILSLCTFNFYLIYWQYKNWKAIQIQEGCKISPCLRSIFSIFFIYSLFKRILTSEVNKDFKKEVSPAPLAIFYILLLYAWRLPDPYWWVTLLGFLPFIYVQRAVYFNNLALNPDAIPDNKFSGKTLTVIIVGGLLTLFSLYSSLVLGIKS